MTSSTQPSSKVQRCLLAVPALSSRFFAKAAEGDADSIFLDLEDSVPPASKVAARAEAIRAINTVDWGRKSIGLRVNALDTQWGLRDIIDATTHCARLDFIVLPRVEREFDVQHVDALLLAIEREIGRSDPLSLHPIIETPLGLVNADSIAGSARRLDAISFGFGDFSIGMGTYESLTGGIGEQWTYAMARIAVACKSHGLRPIDGPYTNFGDLDGLRSRAILAAQYGFEGKWVIHPTQIAPCRDIFSPTVIQIEWARSTLAAVEAAVHAGIGAIGRHGQLLDMAHARLARDIIARAALHELD